MLRGPALLGMLLGTSPGFIGTYRWLIVSTLSLYDVSRSQAFAYSILLHPMSFVPVTAIGSAVIAFLALGRRSPPRPV